jgi:hypothetical protein
MRKSAISGLKHGSKAFFHCQLTQKRLNDFKCLLFVENILHAKRIFGRSPESDACTRRLIPDQFHCWLFDSTFFGCLFSFFHRNSRKKRELVCLFTLLCSQSETSRLSFLKFSRTFHVRHLMESNLFGTRWLFTHANHKHRRCHT